jgi:NAD(P)-dependent dehydrogenase (short-subunit alcohol dehydrogenase family)
MGRLQGKVALVTGAGSGVGRAVMTIFAKEGAKVVGVSRTKAALEETLARVRAAGGEGAVVAADLSTEAGAQAAMDGCIAAFGRIDVLVNAAGVGYSWTEKSPGSMNAIHDTTLEKWNEIMGINLTSCFLMSKLAVNRMKHQGGGGAIVHVASISGFQGLAAAHAYCAAKGGMINLTRAMCVAYAIEGIRTNCVAPGFIDTPMVASVLNLFDDPAMADRLTPMQRPGTPEEIAYGCLYLASDEASYTNGSVLVIDGGTTARQ